MTEPVTVGEVAERAVGMLYHEQMLKQFWQADEQISLNAMVMLCLLARRFDGRVKFIILDDSDQGEWQYVVGLSSRMPQEAGDYAHESDLDPTDEFDDEGWASCLGDRTERAWLPFVRTTSVLPGYRLLDVDKVLGEVDLPWRKADEHGPVAMTWFGTGVWPTCACGFDPRDNSLLTQHWESHGFRVVDVMGHLVKRPIGGGA